MRTERKEEGKGVVYGGCLRGISPNIYKEAGKLRVHYATFLPSLPYSCSVHQEQNDQIQDSDAGASVGVSGQNQQCVTVCSMFRHFVSGTLVAPSGKQGNYYSSL